MNHILANIDLALKLFEYPQKNIEPIIIVSKTLTALLIVIIELTAICQSYLVCSVTNNN